MQKGGLKPPFLLYQPECTVDCIITYVYFYIFKSLNKYGTITI